MDDERGSRDVDLVYGIDHSGMTLEKMPAYRDVIVVVGTSVRKPVEILRAHLDSLANQELPPRVRLFPVFVPDFIDGQQESLTLLMRFVNERGGELIQGEPADAPDFYDGPGVDSHQWSPTAMARVGANKNKILQRALELKADHVFLCDTDLILDRTTIASLLACDKPIVTAPYWTKWSKQVSETQTIYSAPQVWLRHPYQLDGRGMDESEFRQKLIDREVTRVWGFGACTLIQRRVIEAGVNFAYLPDVSRDGMMAGEDRHFCINAERRHIDAYADGWPDIFHVYHADDVAKIPEMASRLGSSHPDRARVGDLVSLRLRALEPLPAGPGRFQQLPPWLERGRLGAIPLMPELEAAVLNLKRGEKRIVRIHPPIHYPLPYYRGRVRLIEVTLLDCKPNGYPPVVDEEVAHGIDRVALNPVQQQSLAEVSAC